MNRRLLPIIGIPVVALVAAGSLAFFQSRSSGDGSGSVGSASLQLVPEVLAEIAGVPATGATLGATNAPVTLTEYGDLRCPICRQWDLQVMPDVITQLVKTNRVRIDYKHWMIIQRNSPLTGESVYAAGRQDRTWAYAMVTYVNQGDETKPWFDKAFSDAAATAAGLDLARFRADRDSPKAAAYVAAIDAEATAGSFTGTPTIVLTGPSGSYTMQNVPTLQDVTAALGRVGG